MTFGVITVIVGLAVLNYIVQGSYLSSHIHEEVFSHLLVYYLTFWHVVSKALEVVGKHGLSMKSIL